MEFNATIDLIIKDLNDAREIIDDLKKYPGVPALQVELAKSKCKSAGEVIALLKNTKDNIPAAITPPPVMPVLITPPTAAITTQPDEITPSLVVNTPPPEVKKEAAKRNPKKVSETVIIADNFSHLSNRFNEQLGGIKGNDDVSELLKTKPLTNLSEAIGVNDKFLFIREIFDGNKDTYNVAIARLDNAESLSDARTVLMSYMGDSDENEAVKQLLNLVKRKLPSDE